MKAIKVKFLGGLSASTNETKIVKESNKYYDWYKRSKNYDVIDKFEV